MVPPLVVADISHWSRGWNHRGILFSVDSSWALFSGSASSRRRGSKTWSNDQMPRSDSWYFYYRTPF